VSVVISKQSKSFRRLVLAAVLTVSAFAFAQKPPVPPVAPVLPVPGAPAMPPLPPMPPMRGFLAPGLPPGAAQRAGVSADVQKKVRDVTFEANEQLIGLEADLKRAQLELEKALAATQVDEATVMNKLEVVSRTELAVRKNRMGLLVRIRRLVGPETWDKLQAEMPEQGSMMMMVGPGGGARREVRVIRTPEGGEQIDIQGD
jgi:Spy/CpxP family protein refolding chaperone